MNVIIIPVAEGVKNREVIILCRVRVLSNFAYCGQERKATTTQ